MLVSVRFQDAIMDGTLQLDVECVRAPIHCGEPLSLDVGAGSSLSAAFTVPAVGVAVATFTTCDTDGDTVLTIDGVEYDDAAGASHQCGTSNERVAIEVADRRAGATVPLEARFADARKTGTLKLNVVCIGAPSTMALSLPEAPPSIISCGDSVSLDVNAGGGQLRRSFVAPPAGVVTFSTCGEGGDNTVLVIDGTEVDSDFCGGNEIGYVSAQKLPSTNTIVG